MPWSGRSFAEIPRTLRFAELNPRFLHVLIIVSSGRNVSPTAAVLRRDHCDSIQTWIVNRRTV